MANEVTTINADNQPYMITLIEKALSSGASFDIIENLMKVQERYQAKEALNSYNRNMKLVSEELPIIAKRNKVSFGNTKYEYEDLATIAHEVRPILSKYGFSYRFNTKQENNVMTVSCIISHEDGHSEINSLSAPVDLSQKNVYQSIGSAVTYLQRYALKAALGLAASRDDDAQAFNQESKETRQEALNEAIEKIGYDEADNLSILVEKNGIDIKKFLSFFKITNISDMNVEQYEKAVSMIEKKASQKK